MVYLVEMTSIEIAVEEYQKIEEIADQYGVTADQYAQIYLTGYVLGLREMAERTE